MLTAKNRCSFQSTALPAAPLIFVIVARFELRFSLFSSCLFANYYSLTRVRLRARNITISKSDHKGNLYLERGCGTPRIVYTAFVGWILHSRLTICCVEMNKWSVCTDAFSLCCGNGHLVINKSLCLRSHQRFNIYGSSFCTFRLNIFDTEIVQLS